MHRALSAIASAKQAGLRERVAYSKFWEGILVVTDITLVGWVFSRKEYVDHVSVLAIVAIAVLTFGVSALHGRTERLIERIERS